MIKTGSFFRRREDNICAAVFFSTIIHIAFFAFLFSFREDKPVPNLEKSYALVTLVTPRQTPPATEPSAQVKRQNSKQNYRSMQSEEKSFVPSETSAEIENIIENSMETNENFVEQIETSAEIGDIEKAANSNVAAELTQEFTNAPKTLYMPQIPYPKAAKNEKIEGIAEISYIIDTAGRVSEIEILSTPHASFENAIRKTVLSWRFTPATKNGKAVSVKASKKIVFKLKD
jgi:TonB family protein